MYMTQMALAIFKKNVHSIYDIRACTKIRSRTQRRKKKGHWQRRFIQISTTLFLKYLFIISHHASLSYTYTHARVCTHTGSDNPEMDIFVRLHGSHSARPMERERHFNLPAYYFMTFLMTYFFVVFPEGRGVLSFLPSTTSKLTN